MGKLIFEFFVLIIMTLNGISDYRTWSVYVFPIKLALFIGIFCSRFPFLCLLSLILSFWLERKEIDGFGSGDILTMLLLGCVSGFGIIRILLVAFVTGTVWSVIKRSPKVPFLFFLFLGYAVWMAAGHVQISALGL